MKTKMHYFEWLLLAVLMISLSACLKKESKDVVIDLSPTVSGGGGSGAGACTTKLAYAQVDSRVGLCGDMIGMVYQEFTAPSDMTLTKIGFKVFNDGVVNPPVLTATVWKNDYMTALGQGTIPGASIPVGTYWGNEDTYTDITLTLPIHLLANTNYVVSVDVPLNTCGANNDQMIIFRTSFNAPDLMTLPFGQCGMMGCQMTGNDLNLRLQSCN